MTTLPKFASVAGVGALLLFSLSVGSVSCTPLSSWFSSKKSSPQADTSVAKTTGTPARPLVSNAFAYARYVAMNLKNSAEKTDWSEAEIRKTLQDSAQRSGISPEEMIAVLSFSGAGSAPTAAAPTMPGSTTGAPTALPASATALRIEAFEKQFERCTSRVGQTPQNCCEALALPMAILPPWNSMSIDQQKSLLASAQAGKMPVDDPQPEDGSSFRVQGLKAWLSVCHPVITKQPQTLQEFMNSEWVAASPVKDWTIRLHPRSRAKRGPRRIFARSDGLVSYAQSLNPADCQVTETEVIVRRLDGGLNFWVYDAAGRRVSRSHFPTPQSADKVSDTATGVDNSMKKTPETVEKPTPDSCMGCHYHLQTRQFDILFPSANELNLPSTRQLPTLCQRPGEVIAEDN